MTTLKATHHRGRNGLNNPRRSGRYRAEGVGWGGYTENNLQQPILTQQILHQSLQKGEHATCSSQKLPVVDKGVLAWLVAIHNTPLATPTPACGMPGTTTPEPPKLCVVDLADRAVPGGCVWVVCLRG
uniref:Uncharacterized protein n=1 Tax=Eutreptiella gymnastica TaxID=73025 RepID=A0A7S4L9Y9_9EUGL